MVPDPARQLCAYKGDKWTQTCTQGDHHGEVEAETGAMDPPAKERRTQQPPIS